MFLAEPPCQPEQCEAQAGQVLFGDRLAAVSASEIGSRRHFGYLR